MFKAPQSDFLVPFDESFRIADAVTKPGAKQKWNNKKRLKQSIKKLDTLQKALYASDRHALLLIFQGMDAAGKDSTVRAVMEGINPAGCQVFSFKKPSSLELDHDFLWRTSCALPERGRIGIFNRSHYEEVLVVRVHPEILQSQNLPESVNRKTIWEDRYESIRDQEKAPGQKWHSDHQVLAQCFKRQAKGALSGPPGQRGKTMEIQSPGCK